MLQCAAHSRRALAAAVGLLATAPVTAAKKKKGKKKKKPAPPLAFGVVQMIDVVFLGSPTFKCMVEIGWHYPPESAISVFDTEVQVAFGSADQIHAQIAAAVQEMVAAQLVDLYGVDVPTDRIAVTLL